MLAEIVLFIAVFFVTPVIVLLFSLEDGPYVYDRLVGYRRRTAKERQRYWINMFLTLACSWVVVLITYFILEAIE